MLDEPLPGVNPVARDRILRGIVAGMRPDAAMVVSSHLVAELESLLDEVVFLNAGRVVLAGADEDLRADRGLSLDGLYREVYVG